VSVHGAIKAAQLGICIRLQLESIVAPDDEAQR